MRLQIRGKDYTYRGACLALFVAIATMVVNIVLDTASAESAEELSAEDLAEAPSTCIEHGLASRLYMFTAFVSIKQSPPHIHFRGHV